MVEDAKDNPDPSASWARAWQLTRVSVSQGGRVVAIEILMVLVVIECQNRKECEKFWWLLVTLVFSHSTGWTARPPPHSRNMESARSA